MEGQNRARASSTGQISNVHPSHSPSPRQFPDHTTQLDLDPTLNSSNFATGNFDTGIISSSPPTDLHYHFVEGSAQFDQNVVLSNGFNEQSLDQPLQSNGLAMELQRTPSALAMHPSPHQFRADMLGSSPTNAFEEFAHQHVSNKSAQQFGSGFLINSEFHPGMQSQHSSINPADIMNSMPSPHNIVPSPSTLMPPEAHSSRQGSPAPTQGQFYSPNHSRHTSLDPSSAISAHNPQLDWAGLVQRAQSQGHRRAPSDHSDVSSSVAPSPFLGQTEAFDLDYSPSPLMNPLQDNSLYPGLGMEQISLSDPQQTHQQQQRMSPGHTPFDSPRMSPHMGLGVPRDNFLLNQDFGGSFAGGPGPDIYTNQPDPFAHLNPRHDSTDMGQAAQMTPQINVELAPPTKQPGLELSQTDNDLDTLSPPARGRPNRTRAKSETFISRPGSACSNSPHLTPMDARRQQRQQSFPPFDSSLSPDVSRENSPARSSRRSSTSSIPTRDYTTRDYILELADPNRPPASGNDKRVQKHPATFQCTLCIKRFTRAYNLRSHLRTHTDERPFICTVCGKAFARQHDRKRHESLHSGEKKFVCKGDLGTSGTWGCGRRFARADALGRHFRSEAGRVCIKPLLDEEAMERQRGLEQQVLNQSMPQGSVNGMVPSAPQSVLNGANGFTLPAALLAQYPALQGLQWDQLGQLGQGEDGEVSGRSSFDAGSQGEGYDDDDADYASGTGGGGFGGGGWSPLEAGEWHSDFEGR